MPRTHKSRYISTYPNKPLIYLAGIRDADRFGAMVKASKRLWPLRVEIEARIAYYNRIARELQREDAVATMARPLFIEPLGVGIQVRSPRPSVDTSPEPAEHSAKEIEYAVEDAEEALTTADESAADESAAAEESAAEESAVGNASH